MENAGVDHRKSDYAFNFHQKHFSSATFPRISNNNSFVLTHTREPLKSQRIVTHRSLAHSNFHRSSFTTTVNSTLNLTSLSVITIFSSTRNHTSRIIQQTVHATKTSAMKATDSHAFWTEAETFLVFADLQHQRLSTLPLLEPADVQIAPIRISTVKCLM